MRNILLLLPLLLISCDSVVDQRSSREPDQRSSTDSDLKVAFVGDQGLGSNAVAVLQLIKDEGAHMVIHSGDFDYDDDPIAWDQQITSVLGESFPYFANVGNHDLPEWDGYQDLLEKRLNKVSGASCVGAYGVNASCTYKGLFFILSGVGTLGADHAEFAQAELEKDESLWRVCSWHKNQTAMQVGGKEDDVGWEIYEICREQGAIIATGHEHSYSRTKTLIDFEDQTVDPDWDDPAQMRLSWGSTFAFVSGIAGESLRNQNRCLPAIYPYGCNQEWAKIYTTISPPEEGGAANYGALFCTFNEATADCYFKTIDDKVIDQFDIINALAD